MSIYNLDKKRKTFLMNHPRFLQGKFCFDSMVYLIQNASNYSINMIT